MAKYTVISDIGKGMLALLRDKLVPNPVDKAESIGLCDPKERGGYIVGIHPYDIKEDTSGRAMEPSTLPDGSVQDPPAMIELYYVISVSSKAELESKALDEAKIIGKIIQIFKDNPNIPPRYMPNNAGMPLESVPISMIPLNMEEKVKVWTMFGESYKLSVFYVVGPVAIDSENIHKTRKRIETVYLGTEQYERKERLNFATHIKEEDIDDEYTEHPDEADSESEDDSMDESLDDSSDGSTDDSLDESMDDSTDESTDESMDETTDDSTDDSSSEDSGEEDSFESSDS